MKAKLHYVFSIAMFLFAFSVIAQNSSWKKLQNVKDSEKISKYHLNENRVEYFELNDVSLKQSIAGASRRTAKTKRNNTIVTIPGHEGELESFNIFEASVFSPELAEKFPDIKSYVGYSLENPNTRIRMSISHLGIKTMISYVGKPTIFMEPTARNSNQYILYSKDSKNNSVNTFECLTIDDLNESLNKNSGNSKTTINEGGANNQTLQKFRIAISVTGEYTNYFGGTVADALAGINATLTRVNDIFETDMAVTFELVNAPELIYTDAVTDPYSDADIGSHEDNFNNASGWSLQLQNNLTSTIGNVAYDIGHLFGATGGGGNAGCIGCVCTNDTASTTDKNKGAGFTSPANDVPEGDTFDLDFVVHEIGHQMGASHTFAFENEGSGVQSEPGSGSTIMAYAGVTDLDDVQLNSDPYFHYQSIKQILDNLSTKSCQTTTAISNSSPIANAGDNYTIPQGTAYILKGIATDSDSGDNLTYSWEQIDNGVVTSSNFSSSLTSGSINRSLPPTTSPDRYIPTLKSVLNGKLTETNPTIGSAWESVSSVSRTLNWALTVRDRDPLTVVQNGQTSYDTMSITVNASSGSFKVTSQNVTNLNLTPGTIETITWDVANSNVGPVNAANVNILLSTDGGLTFPTILVANTPNDGSQNISVPFIYAPRCRIMIEPVNNIFYAVNDEEFAINYTVSTTCPPTYDSALNLNLPVSDSQEANHTINVLDSGVISDVTVNVNISHTYVEDLVVTVTHPNGTAASKLWNRNCSSQSNIVMTFEDWTNNINCNSTGAGNTYAPTELLDVFNGLDAAGGWKINVKDLGIGDSGTLNSWSLDICTQTDTLTNPFIEETIIGIKVFPNPNNGNFWVAFNSETNNDVTMALFDIRGRLVFSSVHANLGGVFREEIKPMGLQSGMYVLTVNDGNIATKQKIIIE
ncbi:zinc-dependent metalloprotease [Confluentibacter flavum]|uniref:Propanediol utilization protein n=1 Tax=Confluentibacter flavum TaxID=1909700 RepID=A0A2N3HLS4_9FLAO|nr:M12 family metallo-peptidase [Confluentibacter flavum]PKQ45905.1 propanediol utilization protein [Confluentibacter flavum]